MSSDGPTWVKEERNAHFYDWFVEWQNNNPLSVEHLCLIDDNNPDDGFIPFEDQ